MLDHLGIVCADLDRAKAFYEPVLATLGHRPLMDFGVAVGYGTDQPAFWLASGEDVGANRESHIAFLAPDADHVRAFHAAALEAGALELHAPRLWPEYHDRYYATFVRDPDGNNVEAVCHCAGPQD